MRRNLLKLLGIHSKILRVHSALPALLSSTKALPPAIAQLELTHRCNLNCPMCYQFRAGEEGELSTEKWKALIDSLPRWTLLTLTGGDPFMRRDFTAILSHALSKNRCNILTNGELISGDQIKLMVEKKLSLIGISLDGTPDTHDGIRGKAGLYRSVERSIRELQDEKKRRGSRFPLLDIKTVILPENMGELREIKSLVSGLDADYWSLSLPKTSPLQFSNRYTGSLDEIFSSGPQNTCLRPGPDERKRLLDSIEELRADDNGPVLRFYPYGMSSAEAAGRHLDDSLSPGDFQPCRIPWSLACVSPRGDVFPCLAFRAGNVREAGLTEIWNGVKFRAFRERISKEGLNRCCLGCCYSNYKN